MAARYGLARSSKRQSRLSNAKEVSGGWLAVAVLVMVAPGFLPRAPDLQYRAK